MSGKNNKSQLYESIFSNEAVKDKRKAKRIIDEKAVHMLEQDEY